MIPDYRMIDCPECEGKGKVDIGWYSDFGRGLEPYDRLLYSSELIDCKHCAGTGKQEKEE